MAQPRREPKTVVLTIRMTSEESEAIREEAQRTHRSISALMVHATIEHIQYAHQRPVSSPQFGIRNKA